MASSSYIDALPYYDKQVEDPAIKASALALIEAELRKTPKVADSDPRLPADIPVFAKTEALSELLEGYPSKRIQGIDTAKYRPPTVDANASLDDVIAAEKQGRIGEGHMSLRQDNIALMSAYGPNAWLIRNYQLAAELKELQEVHTNLKEQITDVNRSRRVFQEEQGEHLTRLEKRWQELVGGTVQLEMACLAMDAEVKGLRRKEEALRQEVAELEEQQ